jgi:predicted DNA-binding ribbon-helix-helix protein
MPTAVKKRSVVVAGHRTSVSLERAFWDSLREIAAVEGKTINQLVSEIDARRSGNLSSTIRVYILTRVRAGALAGSPPPPSAEEPPRESPAAGVPPD